MKVITPHYPGGYTSADIGGGVAAFASRDAIELATFPGGDFLGLCRSNEPLQVDTVAVSTDGQWLFAVSDAQTYLYAWRIPDCDTGREFLPTFSIAGAWSRAQLDIQVRSRDVFVFAGNDDAFRELRFHADSSGLSIRGPWPFKPRNHIPNSRLILVEDPGDPSRTLVFDLDAGGVSSEAYDLPADNWLVCADRCIGIRDSLLKLSPPVCGVFADADASFGSTYWSILPPDGPEAWCMSHVTRRLACTTDDNTLAVFDLPIPGVTPSPLPILREFQLPAACDDYPVFSSDGAVVAVLLPAGLFCFDLDL